MKKMMKKNACFALAAATLLTSVPVYAAETEENIPDIPEIVGSDAEASLTICSYYGGESNELADFALEQIQKKFPNVTITMEAYPEDGGQTIKTRAATGDLPEILMIDDGTMDILAESGNIVPLDDYVEAFNLSNYYQEVQMQSCLYASDGHVYQFPMGNISPVLWYYNKEIFAENGVEVPTNYEELLAAVQTFRENDVIPFALFGKEPWPLGGFFDSFAVKENPAGCYALSTGEAKASDENYQNAILKMETLIAEGIFQDGVTNTDYDTALAMFEEGQCAMFMNGSWDIGTLVDAMGDNVDFMEFYPTADAGREEENQYAMFGTGAGISGMAVTASAEDVELTAQIAFMFAYYREVCQYQRRSLITTPLKTDNLVLENELDAMSLKLDSVIANYTCDTKFIHVFPNTKFSTSLTEEIQKFVAGESAEDFTANVDKMIEKTVE